MSDIPSPAKEGYVTGAPHEAQGQSEFRPNRSFRRRAHPGRRRRLQGLTDEAVDKKQWWSATRRGANI